MELQLVQMWKIIAITSFILMAGLYSLEYYIDLGLTRDSGYNTVSLQMKSKPPEAQKILDSWNPEMRTRAEAALAVDFAFMFLGYGLFFFAVSRLLDSNTLSVFAFLPIIFDSAENLLQLAAILWSRPDLVTAAFHISLFKFLAIMIYLILFVVTAFTKLNRKGKKNAS